MNDLAFREKSESIHEMNDLAFRRKSESICEMNDLAFRRKSESIYEMYMRSARYGYLLGDWRLRFDS